MRLILAIAAACVLAQCASSEETPVPHGRARVIIGVAEAADARDPRYTVLWRQVNPDTGRFAGLGGGRMLEPETHSFDSVQVPGIPGEFETIEVEPGLYALDSVFAIVRDGRVTYIAQGVVRGPERPAFEAHAGETIYLGIWQASIDGYRAIVQPWRLEPADRDAVAHALGEYAGGVTLRETHTSSVTCRPRRINALSQREVC